MVGERFGFVLGVFRMEWSWGVIWVWCGLIELCIKIFWFVVGYCICFSGVLGFFL